MSGLVVDSSPEAARRALRLIVGDVPRGELIEVSARRGKSWKTVHADLDELFGAGAGGGVEAAIRAGREGSDVYIGACSVREDRLPSAGRRGGVAARGSAGALWVDLDCAAPGREGKAYFAGLEAALEAVDVALVAVLGLAGVEQRALVLSSGWGLQVWLPLRDRVEARVASRMVHGLVEGLRAEFDRMGVSGGADKLWDAARVMRFPCTVNWRGGPGLEQTGGVVRWPSAGAGGAFGPGIREVLEALVPASAPRGGGAGGGRIGGGGGYVPLDPETFMDEMRTWEQVLAPAGWTLTARTEQEEVWGRPGRAGERSGVVYADGGGELVVYSDSGECGFKKGLRGSGARGDGSGVGVISRWRAWVDLAWNGDREAALAALEEDPDWIGMKDMIVTWARTRTVQAAGAKSGGLAASGKAQAEKVAAFTASGRVQSEEQKLRTAARRGEQWAVQELQDRVRAARGGRAEEKE